MIAKHTNWKQWWNFDFLSRKKKNVNRKSYKSSKNRIYWTICEMNVLILFEMFRLIVQNVWFDRSTKCFDCAMNENFVLFWYLSMMKKNLDAKKKFNNVKNFHLMQIEFKRKIINNQHVKIVIFIIWSWQDFAFKQI